MNKTYSTLRQATESELHSVVEPLASFVSATDQPQVALRRALAILLSEVKATDCVTKMHVAAWSRIAGSGMNLAG